MWLLLMELAPEVAVNDGILKVAEEVVELYKSTSTSGFTIMTSITESRPGDCTGSTRSVGPSLTGCWEVHKQLRLSSRWSREVIWISV